MYYSDIFNKYDTDLYSFCLLYILNTIYKHNVKLIIILLNILFVNIHKDSYFNKTNDHLFIYVYKTN